MRPLRKLFGRTTTRATAVKVVSHLRRYVTPRVSRRSARSGTPLGPRSARADRRIRRVSRSRRRCTSPVLTFRTIDPTVFVMARSGWGQSARLARISAAVWRSDCRLLAGAAFRTSRTCAKLRSGGFPDACDGNRAHHGVRPTPADWGPLGVRRGLLKIRGARQCRYRRFEHRRYRRARRWHGSMVRRERRT